MTTGHLTLISAIKPKQLGKTYTLTADGLSKTTAGELVAATFEVRGFDTVQELASIIAGTNTSQALMASLPRNDAMSGKIVTKAALKDNPGAISRTKDYWCLPSRPGIAVSDYDPPTGGVPLSREALWELVCSVCPALRDAGVLWWSSGSSFIFNGEQELQGLKGQRLYVMVRDLADSKRFAETLAARLWIAGHGYIAVSSSGSKLVRSTFDLSVTGEVARIDFCAGACVTGSLSQRRGSPVVVGSGGFLDSRSACPDLTADEEARFEALVEAAKALKEPEAQIARELWKAARHSGEVARLVVAGVAPQEATARATRTLESALRGELLGDYELVRADGSTVTVGDVLDQHERFHGAEFKDPLEPEYQNGKTCAKVFIYGAVPTIHSFARGGRTWKLRRQPARVYLNKGRKAETVSELLCMLTGERDVYLRGDDLVTVTGAESRPLDRHALAYLLGSRVAFYSKGRDGDIPADLSADVVDMLISNANTMKTKELKALALLPFARADGSIVTSCGFDERTGVYAHFEAEALPSVPTAPTATEVIEALRTMWGPWSGYLFATDADRGAMLSAIVTAVCRPALDISPGYWWEAPVQGSGKTRAAGALGALVRNKRGGITPFVGGNGAESEWAKKIVSMLRAAESFICIDNIVGHFKSPVLASLITDGSINERVLGGNKWYRGESRIFIAATGNNAQPDADMGRRFVRVRIDPRCEKPQSRDFAFDPVDRALSERLAIAHAVLVLIRAHRVAGAPVFGKGSAGFEAWSGLVRQAVLWAGAMGYTEAAGIGTVSDPATSIMEGSATADPEIESWGQVLSGLATVQMGEPFLARDVLKLHNAGEHSAEPELVAIHDGLVGLLGGGFRDITANRIGYALRNRRDLIVRGLVLRGGAKDRDGVAAWKVARAE